MQKWDSRAPARLRASIRTCACSTGPRWPSAPWFINDGIHYTSAGYEKRALYIADGLAEAFPATGPSQRLPGQPAKLGHVAAAEPIAEGARRPGAGAWPPGTLPRQRRLAQLPRRRPDLADHLAATVDRTVASAAEHGQVRAWQLSAPSRRSSATVTGTRPRAAPSSILNAAARPSASANPSTPSAPDFSSRPGTAAISARSGLVVPDVHSG